MSNWEFMFHQKQINAHASQLAAIAIKTQGLEIINHNWAQLERNYTYTTGAFVSYTGGAVTHPTNAYLKYSQIIPTVAGEIWRLISRGGPGLNWSLTTRGILVDGTGAFVSLISPDGNNVDSGICTIVIPTGVTGMIVNARLTTDVEYATHICKLCGWQNIWNDATYGHTENTYIANDGTLTASDVLAVTGAIPVTAGDIYRIANVYTGTGVGFTTRGVFLNAADAVVGALPDPAGDLPYPFNDVIVPAGATKMRVNFYLGFQSRTDVTASMSINKAISAIPRYDNRFAHLKNKVWATYGDSTTYYADWVRMVENATGLIVWHEGYSGASIPTSENTLCSDSRIASMMAHNPKIVTILGGLNHNNCALGNISDFKVAMGSEDKTTFYGAYAYIIKKILSTAPATEIIILTTTYSYYGNADDAANTAGLTSADYASASRTVAKYFGLPVADVRNAMGVNAYTQQTLLADNVHFAMRGAESVALCVLDTLAIAGKRSA